MLFYKMVPYIFIFLMASLLKCTFLFVSIMPLQVAPADTTENRATNQIKIEQRGSGNSVSIRQTGSSSKGKASLTVDGENNRIHLKTDNKIFKIDGRFQGTSNILRSQPVIGEQFFSIQLSAGSKPSNNFNFKEFYFIFDELKEELIIHQTADEITHNQ